MLMALRLSGTFSWHCLISSKFVSKCLSLFFAISDQQSMSAIANMVMPTSTLMHSANINRDCQIIPGDGTKADINNTLNTQFGQVTDNNLSSWEHLHHLGTLIYS
jgi:hypothetical protein